MRVALLSCNAQAGDAIGNAVAEKLAFFLEHGAEVRVFLQQDKLLHPAVRPHARLLATPDLRGESGRYLTSCDLVVFEFGQAYSLLGLLPLLAGGRARILLDYHGITPPELWPAHNREALEQGCRQRGLAWFADGVVTHSRFTGRELTEATGFPSERLHILGHPLPPGQFSAEPPGQDLRQRLRLTEGRILLFVGRLAANKRIGVILEAMARLRDRQPPLHLAVVGDASDVYALEKQQLQERAVELSLQARLHFLGHVSDTELSDAYRSADLFVMPSRHEGFCVPVVEALASGVPVVAARAGALPETLGNAGYTFTPDDPDDLARLLTRVLETPPAPRNIRTPRIAVVTLRYGAELVGGAERSLRTIAHQLCQAGCQVEVFSTWLEDEGSPATTRSATTILDAEIPVHRFPAGYGERERWRDALARLQQSEGQILEETEHAFLEAGIQSPELLAALRDRQDEFDVVVVGPYLHSLTWQTARLVPEKTLLVPCFHDEPLARLRAWRAAYQAVGGLLYHSPEEQAFAEQELGLNHPGGVCLGTLLPPSASSTSTATEGRYLLYCGRYAPEKNLPLLLEYAQRYHEQQPGRFTFVFVGAGSVRIPAAPWARDLGYVGEEQKSALLAGAAALIQLSRNESLSLAALEAWQQGTPVLAQRRCAVMAGQLHRSKGGRLIEDYASFAAALDDLHARPDSWKEMGRRGQAFVREQYEDAPYFRAKLLAALEELRLPVAERMRMRGLERMASFDRKHWRERFANIVEHLLHTPRAPASDAVEIRVRGGDRNVASGQGTLLVPVRVVNRGSLPLLPEGPTRRVVAVQVVGDAKSGQPVERHETPLPGLLLPGRALSATVVVPVPQRPGCYRVLFQLGIPGAALPEAGAETVLSLHVHGGSPVAMPERGGTCLPLLESIQICLREAEQRRQLPDDYLDVCEGRFARLKRWIKRKLLGNFKRAYVDLLSRQQTAYNRQLLQAVQELAECVALLDQGSSPRQITASPDQLLTRQVQELERQLTALKARLALLEQPEAREESVP